MKITRGLTLVGVSLLTFLFPMAALADCGPGEPGCEFDLPQSVEVNPDPARAAGEAVELGEAGAFQPVEIGAPMPVPARLTPVPFPNSNSNSGGSHACPECRRAPRSDVVLDVPVRYQAPGDVTEVWLNTGRSRERNLRMYRKAGYRVIPGESEVHAMTVDLRKPVRR